MTALATNYYLLPTADTIVGGISAGVGANPWVKKGAHGPEEPTRATLSDPEQPWLRSVLGEIGALVDLRGDWDGYGAGPIRTDVLWYALRLLQSIMDDFPAPQLTPMSHEGILLEWVGDGVRFEIEIEDAGKAYVSYANEKSRIDTSWEVRADFTSLEEPLRAIAGRTSAASTFAT
jgi:hypothetical protein